MGLTYFKRYRMEIDLFGRDFSRPPSPPGYCFLPWYDSLLEAHAEVKYRSFRDEIDANVFPCFNELSGCQRLMREIARRDGFLPGATWLAVAGEKAGLAEEYCGTIQGVRDHSGMGSIQNLGIVPSHRSHSVGTGLLYRSLEGFRRAGVSRVYLEVTADNQGAIRLYRRLGFRAVKTVFKAAEVAYS
jgi:ribosomal protein S18 acetylase RimI-like enzyme